MTNKKLSYNSAIDLIALARHKKLHWMHLLDNFILSTLIAYLFNVTKEKALDDILEALTNYQE